MAKTTNTTKKAVEKKAVSTNTKKIIKEEKTVTKNITTAPAVKKLTTSKEPKKIATAKAPEKIAAKPEPKKIATKEAMKIETKASTVESDVKIPATKSKSAIKKTTASKTTTKKEVVKEKPVKKEPKKVKATTKVEAKKTDKKAPVKKASVAKKSKTLEPKEKTNKLQSYSLEECITCMQAMGVMHSYEDYKAILLDEADLKLVEKNIVEGNGLQDKAFDFEKNGYDLELVGVTLRKIEDTLDIKASDYPAIKKEMESSIKFKISKNDEKNAKEYLDEFKTAEKLLMIGQRKDITSSKELSELIGSNVDKFMKHFFDFAYLILPTWQYDDVKFYEDFAYAILSQYIDLYEKYQLDILIECADLYIMHGDFRHGDESYGYILRDNQIKDYIYYRFATIYESIDMNKAKRLAYESLQYVDERYSYYPNLIEILNK